MKCPRCHSENPDTSTYCGNCAVLLAQEGQPPVSLTKTLEAPVDVLGMGSVLGEKYRIQGKIGQGGMGIVYKAEDITLKRSVALKFLPPHLVNSAELKERFLVEAQAAAALSHPNICVIHEVGEASGQPFIAMEYVQGETLRDRVKRGPLKAEEALDVAIQVASGLSEAHRKGIIHRDIKSANIMVTEEGQAKIMDFGLAKLQGATSLTKSQTTMGTVPYMSPEQAQGERVDQRTDIWSLGVVLYEALAGALPFKGDTDLSVIHSIVHEEPRPLKLHEPPLPEELQHVVARALKKNPDARYGSADEMLKDLRAYQASLQLAGAGVLNLKTLWRRVRRPRVAVPAVAVFLALTFLGISYFRHQARVRWARDVALPEIGRLAGDLWGNFPEALRLAEKAERYIPHDPKLAQLFERCSLRVNIRTEPPGAKVFVKEYKAPDSEWAYLGVSPIEKARLPIGVFRWKLEKEGYEAALAASTTWDLDIRSKNLFVPADLVRVLDKKGGIPPGMARVAGAETTAGRLDDFFIDKYEVTNRQYKEFVNGGGYGNKSYWKHEFVRNGKVLTWEQAMAELVDTTARPGPATWQAGDYPEGQGDYPVSGISWYEATAYAEYAGKNLLTGRHWGIARGEATAMIRWPQVGGFAVFAPFSNFRGKGPVPVGSLAGMTSYGAFDMAGNVREWCWNETPKGRLIRGGAWDDNTYMFGNWSQAPPMDRSPNNGFRCALYPDSGKIPRSAFQPAVFDEPRDFYKEKPVPDSIFQVYKEQFSYDRTDLKSRVESRQETSEWTHERVTFDAAYGGERVIAHLFLPTNTPSPYQTVIYFPGSASLNMRSSADLESYYEFTFFLSFLVKNGRAVLYPVYKGTFERGDVALARIHSGDDSHLFAEYLVLLVKDFERCVDYLETRPDIDGKKLAYCGMSWGGKLGAIIPAVEKRLKASVVFAGGLTGLGRPEVNQINYVTRVKTPTLMMNGKYDTIFPLETSIRPMFDLLGTPASDKQLKLYETDHIPPSNDRVKETLTFLDRYLGPVKR